MVYNIDHFELLMLPMVMNWKDLEILSSRFWKMDLLDNQLNN